MSVSNFSIRNTRPEQTGRKRSNLIIRYGQYTFFILLLLFFLAAYFFLSGFGQVKTALLGANSLSSSGIAVNSAYRFLQKNLQTHPSFLSFQDIKETPGVFDDVDVVWFHSEDSTGLPEQAFNPLVIKAISEYIKKGGKLLLSQEASTYLVTLGITDQSPRLKYRDALDGGYGRKLGLHAFKNHSVFKGMHGGANIFSPLKDERIRQFGYFGERIPANSRCIAVDWAYIKLLEKDRLMLEFTSGKGKVIMVGSYVQFSLPNNHLAQLEKFLNNTIRYLAGKELDEVNFFWNDVPNRLLSFKHTSDTLPVPPPLNWLDEKKEGVFGYSGSSDGEGYWDMAGERIFAMGVEKGGIEEVWSHPFMAIRDYEAGIQLGNSDTVLWLREQKSETTINVGSVIREYSFNEASLKEWITFSPREPEGIMHYEFHGEIPAKLSIRFRSNLRRMWPYSQHTSGDIFYTWDTGLHAFLLKNSINDMFVSVGSDKNPDREWIGPPSSLLERSQANPVQRKNFFGVAAGMDFSLKQNETLNILLVAGSTGLERVVTDYRQLFLNPGKVYKEAQTHVRQIFSHSTMIHSPDAFFNKAYAWSLIATDRFLVNTPGLGKALVAGYASSANGWDGGQMVSGRPGYAWYFGRDGVWSSLALLDYGNFDAVRDELKSLIRFQAIDGKIYHELTTSGVVHYDAADATPLFIILTGRYLRASGDVRFIRENWEAILKAIDFCYSTDTDKDHLIENTNVGHGWVEGGALFGSKTTLYLASCWGEALKQAAYMAGAMGNDKQSNRFLKESNTVVSIINKSFWSDSTRYFSHGKFPDNHYNPEVTVMPAVPLYFGQIEKEKQEPVLSRFAGNGFSSDWGVRIVPESCSFFNPRGYHTGSVWPLYTGWTALAEYHGGNYLQGYQHIMNNLAVTRFWGKGLIEEVLDGEIYQPAGVCHHQCWSETMALQPILEGLLGISGDALKDSLFFSPALPADWDSLKVENIRMGTHLLSLQMERQNNHTFYSFLHKGNSRLKLFFEPVFPPGTKISVVKWNGKDQKFSLEPDQNGFMHLQTSVLLRKSGKLEVQWTGGISMLPLMFYPEPDSVSGRFRLIRQYYEGKTLFLNFEGRTGSKEIFKVFIGGQIPKQIEGATLLKQEGNLFFFQTVFPENPGIYVTNQIKIAL